jgi:hypothetical protein
MLDSHWPELRVGRLRPVDGCMDHHRSSHSHDGLDCAFSDPIVMMSADA